MRIQKLIGLSEMLFGGSLGTIGVLGGIILPFAFTFVPDFVLNIITDITGEVGFSAYLILLAIAVAALICVFVGFSLLKKGYSTYEEAAFEDLSAVNNPGLNSPLLVANRNAASFTSNLEAANSTTANIGTEDTTDADGTYQPLNP